MGKLFEELKRRNVFRVGAAYAVVGWLTLQILDVVVEPLSLPDWTATLVIVLLGIGLPIALLFAWAFELTPDGMKKTGDVDTDESVAATTGQKLNYVTATALVLAVGFIAWQNLNRDIAPAPDETQPTTIAAMDQPPDPASIAVLAFADFSQAGDQEYFGDGIAEELLNILSKLDELSVSSRTSSFAFKGKNRNVIDIAEILNVAHVLEGSVRKAGDRVRITAQLIDAADGQHLWSDTFERELTTENLFAIQDEIAAAIVSALRSELGLGLEGDIAVAQITENIDAYDLYLQARQLQGVMSTENVRRSVELSQRAVTLDPDFAGAWAELAQALSRIASWDHNLDMATYQSRAIAAAERSLGLDVSNARAYEALHNSYFYLNQWEKADAVLRRAQAELPDFIGRPSSVMGMGYLARANEQAIDLARRFPDNPYYYLVQALYLDAVGRNEAAIEQFELAILKGYNGGAEENLAELYWNMGQTSTWTAITAREMLTYDPELLPLLPHMRDLLLAAPDDRPRALKRFRAIARELGFGIEDLLRPGPQWGLRVSDEIAVALGGAEKVADRYWSNSPKFWMWSQTLRELRQSDAFRRRVRESGMLAYWQAHGWPDLCRPLGDDDFECD